MVPAMAALREKFLEVASFVTVYVAEAHAQDEWPIRSSRYNGSRGPVLINQHRSTRERCAAAAAFAADFGITMPVLVDPMPGKEQEEEQEQQQDEQQKQQQEEEEAAAAAAHADGVTIAAAAEDCLVAGKDAALATSKMPAVAEQQQQLPSNSSNLAAAGDAASKAAARDAAAATMASAAAAAASCRSCVGPSTSCSTGTGETATDQDCSSSHVIGYGASGPFDAALAPWPLRFYVLDRAGVLLYKADPKDCQYDMFELWQWLEERQQQSRQQQQQ